ncbi:nicotinate-nucleotide adenylyltransferase [Pseudohalocynthiibacter aestuariivivens]|uniref:Probable nicotinate-nucleotide adenylyltransferase n=1 Tax=Pseudohalocynthiibacter aestuariivivens TaxID=1591409 RepID=A0ABV5JJT9_9RHOB|nr:MULTISPECIES: nicotinate-nucleotide adenylyltransferase [Pseudohalocynthiibacter]MBS9718456.1 nicotinate-nucleotide adenylyltransferase [Pseudohalocynthiibacter aestuariivivens]MCK0104075.1 nicotinate-nucleotide adenylyltransferase [Pseudohalocynthiibacter sp. F2068]
MRHGMPYAPTNQVIGLLGGSFDPPHMGHVHISQEAMKRFRLDRVWWLVSPGNPLKTRGPAPLEKRLDACRKLVKHPRIEISDFEAKIGTRYTAETLEALFQHYPQQRFVWLMGADNLASFHKWDRWQWIMENIPVGVIARPGDRITARLSPAAKRYARFRLRGRESVYLSRAEPPAWCFINAPMVDISSTDIRAKGRWAG